LTGNTEKAYSVVCWYFDNPQGFQSWSRRDFNQFVKACAEYRRDDRDKICHEVEGKEPDEVGGALILINVHF